MHHDVGLVGFVLRPTQLRNTQKFHQVNDMKKLNWIREIFQLFFLYQSSEMFLLKILFT